MYRFSCRNFAIPVAYCYAFRSRTGFIGIIYGYIYCGTTIGTGRKQIKGFRLVRTVELQGSCIFFDQSCCIGLVICGKAILNAGAGSDISIGWQRALFLYSWCIINPTLVIEGSCRIVDGRTLLGYDIFIKSWCDGQLGILYRFGLFIE